MKSNPSPPQKQLKEPLETATLAGGCFWCVESDLEKIKGVKRVISGYAGGDKANPSYKEVSGGGTEHLEAVQVFFDPQQISYPQILDVFWRKINPLFPLVSIKNLVVAFTANYCHIPIVFPDF